MSGEKTVGVLEELEQNEVDRLRTKIAEIQSACKHDFKLARTPRLVESLVPGVYVGKVDVRGGLPTVGRSVIEMILVCKKCSTEEETSILKVCPHCLNPMVKEPYSKVVGSRERYFGKEYLYYAIALSSCSACGFTIASDEWDQ